MGNFGTIIAYIVIVFGSILAGIALYGQVTGRMDLLPTITGWIGQIPVKIQEGWAWLQAQGIGWDKVIAMTGGIVTIGTLVVTKLRSSLAQSKAQAAQAQSTIMGMQDNFTTINLQKDQQIASLEQKVQTLTNNDQSNLLGQLQTQNQALNDQNQKLINDINTMERTYQNTINYLKQQQVTVVK